LGGGDLGQRRARLRQRRGYAAPARPAAAVQVFVGRAMGADKVRCGGAEQTDGYRRYHDLEWGRPQHDDRVLFEFLILEGAQAGLSWRTILEKRAGYRKAFANFDPTK